MKNIVSSANNKLWMLRHLKQFKISEADLVEMFSIFIRSRLEYCVPVWNASLTNENKEDIERIQKTALKIILGESYEEYETALDQCKLKTLDQKREDLCLMFALKCTNVEQHKHLFKLSENPLLHHPTKYETPFCLLERYRKSPIPYLTDLLNRHHENPETI